VWDANVLVDFKRDDGDQGLYASYGDKALWDETRGPGINTDSMPAGSGVEWPADHGLLATPNKYLVEFVAVLKDSLNVGQQQDLDQSAYRNYYRIVAQGRGSSTGRAVNASTFTRRF
jgi:hypothetical protein